MRTWVSGDLVGSDPRGGRSQAHDALTLGDGVFEAVKVVQGSPFALTRHLRRLSDSAEALGLPAVDGDEVRRGVDAVLEGVDLPWGRIRITFTEGAGGRPMVTVTATASRRPVGPARVVTVPWTREERGPLTGHKATAYADDILALRWASGRGADEALFANTAGNLCEGTTSNVFYVLDGQLRTPSLGSGCLPGISRALVLEWYGADELDEPVDVLQQAEEIFVVSTTRDVQAVGHCDGRALDAAGPVTREVAAVWALKESENPDP